MAELRDEFITLGNNSISEFLVKTDDYRFTSMEGSKHYYLQCKDKAFDTWITIATDGNYYFHNNWKYLMQVFDLLNRFEDWECNVVLGNCYCTIYDDDSKETIIDIQANSSLEALYIAIVKFIELYNKRKQEDDE